MKQWANLKHIPFQHLSSCRVGYMLVTLAGTRLPKTSCHNGRQLVEPGAHGVAYHGIWHKRSSDERLPQDLATFITRFCGNSGKHLSSTWESMSEWAFKIDDVRFLSLSLQPNGSLQQPCTFDIPTTVIKCDQHLVLVRRLLQYLPAKPLLLLNIP